MGEALAVQSRRAEPSRDKPRGNDELRKSEEAMPRVAERQLEKAATYYKTQTGLGCDDFHQGPHGPVKRNNKTG